MLLVSNEKALHSAHYSLFYAILWYKMVREPPVIEPTDLADIVYNCQLAMFWSSCIIYVFENTYLDNAKATVVSQVARIVL